MKTIKKILFITVAALILVSCSNSLNPYVEELMRSEATLKNISLTSGVWDPLLLVETPTTIGYGINPRFAANILEYTILVPRNTNRIHVLANPTKDETIMYKVTGQGQNNTGDFTFEPPSKTMLVEIVVSKSSMNTQLYRLRIARVEYPWINTITVNSDITGTYALPFTPVFDPVFDDADIDIGEPLGFHGYEVWVNAQTTLVKIKATKRAMFIGDENIHIWYDLTTATLYSGTPGTTTGTIIPDGFGFIDIPFPIGTDEETVIVSSEYVAENPAPNIASDPNYAATNNPVVTQTIRIRRPAKVTWVTGTVDALAPRPGSEDNSFSLSGDGTEYFKEGEAVTITVTPPFGCVYDTEPENVIFLTVVGASPVPQLFSSGADKYTFIMGPDPISIHGAWDSIPAATYTNVRYVSEQGSAYSATPGAGDGTSWYNATTDLQALMDAWTGIAPNNYEIWISNGRIKPDWTTVQANNPAWSTSILSSQKTNWDYWFFFLRDGIQIYGGFEGTEETLLHKNARNIKANETLLSGYDEDKGYIRHLIVAYGISTTTILDGLTMTETMAGGRVDAMYIKKSDGSGGHTINETPLAWSGAGLYAIDCANTLQFNKVTIRDNFTMHGAGAYLQSSSPVFTDCVFSGNSAYDRGGALYFIGNSSPLLKNCVLESNRAGYYGGAVANGTPGYYASGAPKLVNVRINNNFSGMYGAGVFNYGTSITLTNVTITANNAISSGGGLYNYSGSITLQNSIIWNNTAPTDPDTPTTITGFANPDNKIGVDPVFAAGSYVPAAAAFRNAGSDALYLSALGIGVFGTETDLAGNPRHEGTAIDIGAYEHQ
jgi:predicted outer membrane repeat protein